MKTVFTTGEAAKICKVSQQTIIRCFDSGQLKGFRVPGSRFRRIPRDVLYKFMKENGIPTDALESGKRKALIVVPNPGGIDVLFRSHYKVRCRAIKALCRLRFLFLIVSSDQGQDSRQRDHGDPTAFAFAHICWSDSRATVTACVLFVEGRVAHEPRAETEARIPKAGG